MQVKDIALYPYKYPTDNREGLVLKLTARDGKSAWGEVAPLPGWSKETLSNANEQVKAIKEHLLLYPFNDILSFYSFKTSLPGALYPSVEFGIESALFDLLFSNECKTIPLSGLLSGTEEEIWEKAKEIKYKEFTSAKLKVGHLSLQKAIKLTDKLLRFFGDSLKLRIDINRSWPAKEAVIFGNFFPKNQFDYIEEPMPTLEDLQVFYGETLEPFALDEHLREYPLKKLIHLQGLKALILKPTLLGGYSTLQKMIDLAHANSIHCILSSSYESPLGIKHITKMQNYFSLTHPAGLDTTFNTKPIISNENSLSHSLSCA